MYTVTDGPRVGAAPACVRIFFARSASGTLTFLLRCHNIYMFKYLAANLEMPFASVSVVVVVVAAIDGNNPYRNVLVLLSRRRPFR